MKLYTVALQDSELFLITVPLTLSNVRITCILVVIVTASVI